MIVSAVIGAAIGMGAILLLCASGCLINRAWRFFRKRYGRKSPFWRIITV